MIASCYQEQFMNKVFCGRLGRTFNAMQSLDPASFCAVNINLSLLFRLK